MARLHLLLGKVPADLSACPALARLIARGRPADHPPGLGYTRSLAQLFGIDYAALPAIEIAEQTADRDAHGWFRADPTHLLAGMRSLTLFDAGRLGLTEAERAELLTSLTCHFADVIEFRASGPGRWHARPLTLAEVETVPLDEIAGGEFGLDLIAGPGARDLQRIAMEIQMLLYDHPVNAAREMRNQATVNSLWLWGGAAWQAPAKCFDRVCADEASALALGRAAGCPVAPLPEGFDAAPIEGDTLVAIAETNTGAALDNAWFAPVLRALQGGRLHELSLILAGRGGFHRIVSPWRARAFWR